MDKMGLSLGSQDGQSAPVADQATNRLINLSEGGLLGGAQDTFRNMANQKDVYGEGGLQSRLAGEEKDLAGQGFKLNSDDMTSYGQTAGDISRLFGQQEQSAAQSLARRGLGSAASGAAGATFSGLAGNKNEMLAKAQTDIAQRRYQDTMNRLQQTRNMMTNLSGNALNGIRGLASDRLDEMKTAYNAESGHNDQIRQAAADAAANRKPGLFETVGNGLQAGIGNLATQAPGMALGGATGGQYGTMSNQQQMMMSRKT
jgi:hypothetical protein